MQFGQAHPKSDEDEDDGSLEVGADRFSVPIRRLGGLRFSISYTVVMVLAVLLGVVINVLRQPGNADLPRVAGLALLAWTSGWGIQALAYLGVARAAGYRVRRIRFGILGIETVPMRWPARLSLFSGFASLAGCIGLACSYRLVNGVLEVPSMEVTTDAIWELPSIGLGEVESVWRTASWLCFVQGLGQLCPLPRTIGRQLLAALVALLRPKAGIDVKVKTVRLLIDTFAFATLGIAIWLMKTGQDIAGVGWIFLMCLSVLAWLSSRRSDLVQTMEAFEFAAFDKTAEDQVGLWKLLDQRVRQWRVTRRIRIAQRNERAEAVDAQRVDEILNQLHDQGVESLTVQDRQLLEKVSASLRKQRSAE